MKRKSKGLGVQFFNSMTYAHSGKPFEKLAVYVFIFVVFCILGATFLVNNPISFSVDDAYITIANSELILRGGPDLFGNYLPTGVTSPIHLFLETMLSSVFGGVNGAYIAAVSMAVIYSAGLWKMFSVCFKNKALALCGGIIGLVSGGTWMQLMNGLETGMAMAAVTWSIFLLFKQRYTLLSILCAALPFIRPELVFLTFFVSVFCMWDLRYRRYDQLRFLFVLCFVGCAIALAVYFVTGSVVPLTAEAKTAFFARPSDGFLDRVAVAFSLVFRSPIAMVLAGSVFLIYSRIGIPYLALFFSIIFAAALELPDALYHNWFRYLYILLPIGLFGWGLLFSRFMFIRSVVYVATFLSACMFIVSGWRDYKEALSLNLSQRDVAEWISKNAEYNGRILIHDAGYVPWYLQFVSSRTDLYAVDVVGLKTPSSIAINKEFIKSTNGADRWKAVNRIACKGSVNYLIDLDVPFWADISLDLRDAGWRLDHLFGGPGGYNIYLTSSDMCSK